VDVQQALTSLQPLIDRKDYGKVLGLCREMLAKDPRNPEVLVAYSTACAETGDRVRAIELLKRALTDLPGNAEVRFTLAVLLRREGRIDESLAAVGPILASGQASAEALALYSFCKMDAREYRQALPRLEQAIALQPHVANYHHKLGMIHQALRNYPAASNSYHRAIELDATNPSSFSNLSQVLLELKEYDRAVSFMEQAIALNPDVPEYYVLLARGLIAADRKEGIETLLEKAVSLKDTLDVAHRMLGYRNLEFGRFPLAERHFKRALELRPGQAALYEALASCRKFTIEDDPFKREMEQFARTPGIPSDQKRHLLYALGKYHNDVKDYETAFKLFDQGNDLMKDRLKGKPYNRKLFSYLLNGFIETFDKEYFESHRNIGSASNAPIIIVGVIRSGTTLLEEILARHPKVGAGGELHFWHQNLTGGTTKELGLISKERAATLQTDYLRLLKNIAPDCDRVTDKMPQNFMLLGWIHALFPKAKIIVCRRQPVDIALSIWMTSFGEAVDYAHDKKNIIYYISEFQRLIDHWSSVLPSESITQVWYEDVVADQEGQVRSLLQFLDLEWDPVCLETSREERAIDTPSMWQARQKIYQSSSQRWRNYEPWLGEFSQLLK
jgi:tetratricopeptide (TPR) repeat protein